MFGEDLTWLQGMRLKRIKVEKEIKEDREIVHYLEEEHDLELEEIDSKAIGIAFTPTAGMIGYKESFMRNLQSLWDETVFKNRVHIITVITDSYRGGKYVNWPDDWSVINDPDVVEELIEKFDIVCHPSFVVFNKSGRQTTKDGYYHIQKLWPKMEIKAPWTVETPVKTPEEVIAEFVKKEEATKKKLMKLFTKWNINDDDEHLNDSELSDFEDITVGKTEADVREEEDRLDEEERRKVFEDFENYDDELDE